MPTNLTFTLESDEYSRIIFQFDEKRSSCHSFGDNPPKNWQDVYKVYYTWSILEQYRDREEYEWSTDYEFSVWDEGSALRAVGEYAKAIADGKKKYIVTDPSTGEEHTFKYLNDTLQACGDGADWTISEKRRFGRKEEKRYIFSIWNRRKGYRFMLPDGRMREFGEFLTAWCEYMLENGVGM